jgi:glycosyltransferase involved in cell wall biosynthesis
MFDLIAMRTPAIVSRTRAVEAYFDDGCFAYFESGDERGLADAIVALHADPELRARLVRRASAVAAPYRWEVQREVYRRVVACAL